jgi:radical SAM superfamily enzyme YgiQ (UPF0313 family)
MKKILLIAINARYTHSCLALYCLKSYAAGLDFEIVIREFTINQNIEQILSDIASEQADLIAFSVYIWNAELVKKILPVLKLQGAGSKILLGGPEVSYNPESWLESFPNIDFIVVGQGEAGFRRVLECDCIGMEKIVRVQNPRFADMPNPYTDEDLSNMRHRYVYYESSRGCPFHCTYCLSSREDQKLELKKAERVIKELLMILGHRPRLLKFVDRTFNVRGGHHRDIWNFILENYRSGPTGFHFEIHPSYLDDDDFSLLSRCPGGLFQFEIGVQSVNPDALNAVRRTGTWIQDRAVIERLVGLGTIRVHLDLIAGLPFDDMASVRAAFNEAYALRPAHIQLGFLKILPGTEMADRTAEYGIRHADRAPYQVIETRWLDKNEIRLLERIAYLVDRLRNTGRFESALAGLEREFESPFDMFRVLAEMPQGHGPALTRGWESGAAFLMRVIGSQFFKKRDFLLEALRRDWQAGSKGRPFPEGLLNILDEHNP